MNLRFPKIFPWPVFLLLAIALAIVAQVVYPGIAAPYARKHYIDTWVRIFREHPSKAEIVALPKEDRPDFIFIRDFSDGSWVAAQSESFHDNGLFDATVFIDSTHSLRTSSHHFCGYEGLCNELAEPKAANLAEFYAGLQARKIDLPAVP